MQGANTAEPPSTAASLQPLVPGPSSFVRLPAAPSATSAVLATASDVSSGGSSQSALKDQPSMSDASTAVVQTHSTAFVSQSALSSANIPLSSIPVAFSNTSPGPQTSLMLPNPPFARPGTSGTPGPPGLVGSSAPAFSVNNPFSPANPRPGMPAAPGQANPTIHPQIYPPYHSLAPVAGAPQGIWLQPPPMGGMPRGPFVSHPTVFPGSYPFQVRGVPPAVPFSGSQPPGVTPVGSAGTVPAVPAHQLVSAPGQKTEALTGIDIKAGSLEVGKQIDAWTAHKTETGVVYYYNALTGQSTYEKPPGFEREPDKVPLQPTPVSMEHLSGTDWALITTNDGKKYYYNSKTKVSSWHIPSELTDLRRKQEIESFTERPASVPHVDSVTEKGSDQLSLSAPAISNGGRDANSLRSVNLPGSSALDLVKKKLHDSGAPALSSISSAVPTSEASGGKAVEVTLGAESDNGTDKAKGASGAGDLSDSSTDSEDEDSGPTKEERIKQFKEMLKERGVAPFSKWEKELPKIVFDPRFKAIPSHSVRRSLFEQYVKTRAEEERREKRAAQKAAIEGFKQLLDEASKDIDQHSDYRTFKRKWGSDPRFEALERKDREALFNERVLSLKRAAEQKAQEIRAAAASDFKSMLRERDVTINSRWSRVKDSLRNDPRYKSVVHEEREILFNEYISELKAAQGEVAGETKSRDEQEKLKERERELRKRKEREVQEMERVRQKVRRKEAIASYQALLVETIRDPEASWTESKPKLEKDPQRRASNPDLDPSDMEKLFREHVKTLYERCAHDFKALLVEVMTTEATSQETEDGKTVLNSWSTAKRLLKPDPRYSKMPRKDREALWRRYAEDISRKQIPGSNQKEEKHTDAKHKSTGEARRTHDPR